MFCDLGGSTGFGERVDAETARSVVGRYHTMLQEVVDAHDGTVAKFIGDGMLAFFGIPEVAEDDAERAVAAAAEMQRRFTAFADEVARAHGERLTFRIGINSGEVVIGEGDADVVGDALNVAARLEKACAPGRVLVGEATWRLTRSRYGFEPLGEVTVTGRAEPVAAFVLAEDERPEEQATPFVGRDGELGRMRSALDDAVTARAARFVSVIGPPGVGKTRLSRELEASIDDGTRVLHTACDRAGGSTFGPLVELIRPAIGDDPSRDALAALVPPGEPDRDRVVDGLPGIVGLGEARSTEEAFWAVRRMIELLAADQPLVLVIDDIQWAEARLLDLLEHLAEWVADAPVLLVGLARPELRELRPTLAERGRRVTDVLVLDGLDAGATAQLANRMLGGDLPAELVARLPASTDGNPLFVRELVRMLVDEGVIRREGDDWRLTVDVDVVEVPPTIRSLLAARIERLPVSERTVLERASVVGPDFVLGALRDLVDEPDRLDARLEALRRRDLVEPTGAYWGDDPVWRFHHVLIRDAVYGRLLKEARAELHERVGDWTAAAAPRVVGEHETTIAHHYEQAHDYRSQLGALDEHGRELGRTAAGLLATASRRALAADDLVAAGSLAVRGLACLDEGGADLTLLALEALLASGELADVPRLLDGVADEAWAGVYRAQWLDLTAPDRLDEAERLADAAATAFGERGDGSGQAKAHLVRAGLLARRGRLADSEVELDRAMGAAREAGDTRRLVAALGAAPAVALWGPSPVARAGGRCLDVIRLLRITTASPVVEATSLRHQAVLEALRGRFEPARKLLAGVRSTVEELGLRRDLMEVELFTGLVDLLDGDAGTAESHLRIAHEGLTAMGAAAAAGASAVLARALLAQGRLGEAAALDAGASDQDLKTAITWRSVRADLLAARGDAVGAVTLAEEAVALAEGTDFLLDHADALSTLATVRRAAGDEAGADTAAAEAGRRYEEKGSTVHGSSAAATPVAPPPPSRAGDAATRAHRRPQEGRGPAPSTGNRAVQVSREMLERLRVGDVDAIADLFSPTIRQVDQRPGLGGDVVGRRAMVEHLRVTESVLGGGRLSLTEVVAERGDRLAVVRTAVTGGEFEVEVLSVIEVDEHGRQCYSAAYDADDEATAMQDLEERHWALSTENTAVRLNRGLFTRWMAEGPDAVADFYTLDFRLVDRRAGLRAEHVGRAAMTEQMRVITDLLGDSTMGIDEVIAQRGDHLALWRQSVRGDVEVDMFCLAEVDGTRQVRAAIFDEDDLPAALAELEAWHAESSENLAVRATRALLERWMTDGPDGLMDGYVPSARIVDRRQGLQIDLIGREAVASQLRAISELRGDDRLVMRDVIAQRGELLVLFRQGVDGDIEVELLTLVEVDPAGREVLAVQFAADDVDAAMTELEARHEVLVAQNLAARQARAFVATWMVDGAEAAAERFIAEGYRWEDRRQGLTTIVEGRDALLEMLLVVADVFPDGAFETTDAVDQRGDHLAIVRERIAADVEVETLVVAEVDEAGLLVAGTVFDPADLDDAAALLDARHAELVGEAGELSGPSGATDPAADGLRAAVDPDEFAVMVATSQALGDGDATALDALLADDVAFVDHRPLGLGAPDREGLLAAVAARASTFGTPTAEVASEQIRLDPGSCLFSYALSTRNEDGVAVEVAGFILHVVRNGLVRRIELFSEDDQAAAEARYDELAAAAAEPLVVRVYRRQLELLTAGDIEAVITGRAVNGVAEDRRRGLGSVTIGREANRSTGWVLYELLGGATFGIGEMVDHRGEHLALVRLDTVGALGPTVQSLAVIECNADELVTDMVVFDLEALDEARAELDRRVPANRAVTFGKVFNERWMAKGADAIADLLAVDMRFEDSRVGLRTTVEGRDACLAHFRAVDELIPDDGRVITGDVIAHRGDLLRLVTFDAPLIGIEMLSVAEFDDDGRLVFNAMFDLDDLAAAHRALDERFLQGEGAAFAEELGLGHAVSDALDAGDMEVLAQLVDEDFVSDSHRPIGYGEVDRDGWLAWMGARRDAQGDTVIIDAEVVLRPGLVLMSFEQRTRTTSGLEGLHLGWQVSQIRHGRLHRLEVFADDDRAAAEARFHELSAEPDENLAARRSREFVRRWMADGPDVARDFGVEGYRFVDHRAGLQHAIEGIDGFVENLAVVDQLRQGDDEYRVFAVVAQRGERLALVEQGIDGNVDIHNLFLHELDEEGRAIRGDSYEWGDLEAALTELDRRFAEGEGRAFATEIRVAAAGGRAIAAGDREAVAALLTDDFVFVDHRPIGWGEQDRESYLAAIDARSDTLGQGVAIARDLHLRTGAFLSRHEIRTDKDVAKAGITVAKLRGKRVERMEVFAEDDLAAAEARFAELAADANENRAVRLSRNVGRRWRAEGVEAVRSLFVDDYRFVDHRPALQDEIEGIDAFLANLRTIGDLTGDLEVFGVVAQRGQRLALMDQGFAGEWDIRTYVLLEVDDAGLGVRGDVYASEDLAGAIDELDRRFLAAEGAPHADELRVSFDAARMIGGGEVADLETLFAEDFVYVDRAPLRGWLGEVQRAEYLAGVARRLETFGLGLAIVREVLRSAPGCHLFASDHRSVSPEGFEAHELGYTIHCLSHGRITRQEVFGDDDRAAAEARFDELVASPPTPGLFNAATRRLAPYGERFAQRDWAWLQDLMHEDVRNDDRRSGVNSGVSVGRDRLLELTESLATSGFATMHQVPVAIRGERLALYSRTWAHEDGFELGLLALMEVDADGHLVAHTMWDPDDWVGALDELERRYVAGEGAPLADEVRLAFEVWVGVSAGERAALEPLLAADFVYADRAPLRGWLGDVGRDEFLAGVSRHLETFGSGSNVFREILRSSPGCLLLVYDHWSVTPDGIEALESGLSVHCFADGRLTRLEVFAEDDLATAEARFDELAAERSTGET
jgi:class 3 adenylate cyclase